MDPKPFISSIILDSRSTGLFTCAFADRASLISTLFSSLFSIVRNEKGAGQRMADAMNLSPSAFSIIAGITQ